MINLIKNEFKKNFSNKHFLLTIFIIVGVSLIYKYSGNIKSFINTLIYLPPFIGIIISLYSSSIVSKEYTSGTFKLYLTKPTKRWKIIISKIIYLFLLSIYYELLIITTYFIIIILTNNLSEIKIMLDAITKFIKYTPPIYFIICFSTFLSTIFKSSKISATLSTILLISSLTISELLFTINWNFVEFTPLPYLDFSIFSSTTNLKTLNSIYNINLNITSGSLILLIYSIFFLVVTIIIFKNKDINA